MGLCALVVCALVVGLISACSTTQGTIDPGLIGDALGDSGSQDISFGETLSDTVKTDGLSDGDVTISGDSTTTVLPGQFSAPCKDDNECDSNLCIQNGAGKMCSHDCTSAPCESGFVCQPVKGSVDTIYACVPKFKHICDPCNENKDCNDTTDGTNVCIGFGAVGSFCGATCDPTDSDCPGGYGCETVINPATGAKVSQCKHKGICDCSANAIQAGLSTVCSNKDDLGHVCKGLRQCGVGGLAECSASVPAPEECNGIDDDCNGFTDDLDTANAKCDLPLNEFNVVGKPCKGKLVACVNGVGKCEGAGAAPEICNQVDDNCDGVTDNVPECDDKDPCTNDTCDAAGCQHKQLSGVGCDDGNICTQTDKCLSGVCTGGNKLNCDDQDPCTTDACDPFTGCTHEKASDAVCKEDGNLCTVDTCKDGTCQHIVQDNLKCLDDGKPCTEDVCQGGACNHVNSTAPCDDGNACTEGDVCSGGKCLTGKLKTCDDGNPCTLDKCDPNIAGGCTHDNNDYAACTSGSSDCPVGECAGGTCYPKANATCQTKVQNSICSSDPIAGVCTASGKCVVTKPPIQYTCPGCNGICLNCAPFGQFCLPFNPGP